MRSGQYQKGSILTYCTPILIIEQFEDTEKFSRIQYKVHKNLKDLSFKISSHMVSG